MQNVTFILALGGLLLGLVSSVFAADGERTWTVDGVERTGKVVLPADGQKKPEAGWPVVFVFHGHGGTVRYVQRQFAIEQHWPAAVVVYLQGLPTKGLLTDREGDRPGWDMIAPAAANRDVRLYDVVLKSLVERDGVDPKRVFATGNSNGGGFTYLLWSSRADTLAAVAPCSAAALRTYDLSPKPALIVAGKNDRLVRFELQEQSMQRALKVNACTGQPKAWASDGDWYDSTDRSPTVLLKYDGGHPPPNNVGQVVTAFFKAIATTDK